MYLLIKVLNTRSFVSGVVGSVLSLGRELLDDAFNRYLNTKLRELLNERRLAHLIRLGQGLLFGKKSSQPRNNAAVQRELARRQLMDSLPGAALGLGSGALAVHNAFEIIQKPHLNKQLVYNLLDLCIVELFPELRSPESSPSGKAKELRIRGRLFIVYKDYLEFL
ncbi:sorting nexin-14-like [Manduca sexta]|uniref:sorting nexin-14-like n=1 Tax=Manduca sexta TaxID=7130 RepID=UPI00188E5B48|nr:sorting nexin-14-like [Manduca sexta]